MTLTRRSALAGAAALLAPRFVAAATDPTDPSAAFAALEARLAARLGVCIRDTGTGRTIRHRGGERFPLCSTFKVLAAGAVLARVDGGVEDLSRRLRFGQGDLVTYSPVTERFAGGEGMTLAELCGAAITRSDNTAGNLLLTTLGGPAGLTAFARSIGDRVTRLDRWETALNAATPGDPRDTTTADAMATDLEALVLGRALKPASRRQLAEWMVATKTGDAKLRAGLPKDWRIGDKTGGGDHGSMADVAVLWPPGRAPILACVYITETAASFDDRNAAIAEIGRLLPGWL